MDNQTANEILLECLSFAPREGRTVMLQQQTLAVWKGVIKQAERRGLTPWLFYCLKTRGLYTCLPPTIQEDLLKAYYLNLWKNSRILGELAQILTAFQTNGIAVMVLKGAHLAESIYRDIALRPMLDVDLLIHPTDLALSLDLIQKRGYTLEARKAASGIGQHHVVYVSPKGVTVELHQELTSSPDHFGISIEEIWQQAQSTILSGVHVSVMPPAPLLSYLCYHTAYHHVYGHLALRGLCDIGQVIRYYDIQLDWEKVCHYAYRWKIRNGVYLTLLLAKRLLGANVPDLALQAIVPAEFDPRIFKWAKHSIYMRRIFSDKLTSDHWGQLHNSKGFADKLRLLWRIAFPTRETIEATYRLRPGAKRVFLYYPVRHCKLLRRHSLKVLHLWLRDDHARAWLDHESGRVALEEWLNLA